MGGVCGVMCGCGVCGGCVWEGCGVWGCVSGYAFRGTLRYIAETWHGVWDGPLRFMGNFPKRPYQRSSRDQSALEMSMITEFSHTNPWPERSALLWSKVTQGSAGFNRGQPEVNLSRNVRYGHEIWSEESLTRT